MAPTRAQRLNALAGRASELLQAARDAAEAESGYNSEETRTAMAQAFETRFKKPPYVWQLDAAEAFILKLDAVVIAGTGAGKTIPFMLPLLLNGNRWVLILSPLKVLQQDQCKRFKKMGINAVVVNGDTWDASLEKILNSGTVQAVFSSPEMCLKHNGLRKWLKSDAAISTFSGTILDEAHCIPQWSGEFRKLYGQLDALRSLFPLHSPFHAVSATLTPDDVYTVAHTLKIDLSDAYFVNLGNDRPNITPSVVHMNSASDFAALDALLPAPDTIQDASDLPKTIIFTNSIRLTHAIALYLRRRYGLQLEDAFAPFHAHRSLRAKIFVMRHFRLGRIRILIATEAAGMGADIPDIELVIQFGFPKTLSMWIQRAGRAGRSPEIQARAVLLAEVSAFKQRQKRRPRAEDGLNVESEAESDDEGSDDEGEKELEWGKQIDPALREYATSGSCRRDITDTFFNNPTRREPTGPCCDVCTNSAPGPLPDNEPQPASRPRTPEQPHSTPSSAHSTPSKHTNANGKRPMRPRGDGPSTRRSDLLKSAQTVLDRFRRRLVLRDEYHYTSFTAEIILPESTLKSLASNARLKTVADINTHITKPPWAFAEEHGEEALGLLAALDRQDRESRDAKARANREVRKQNTAARNAEKKAVNKEAREAKKVQKAQARQLEKELRQQRLRWQGEDWTPFVDVTNGIPETPAIRRKLITNPNKQLVQCKPLFVLWPIEA
ncbi:Bloom syndrome [Mycena chlorophos]|uniref:DNA 3'-5' helicase n=1 Tax=Mycena chlorophos TaxID=658473 RepID=A0A8H6TKH7_MYCCL|nr:Bloom syndrome [Mycena chlorophos]